MAKYGILLVFLFVGGFAFPTVDDEGPGFDEEMSIFFDHTGIDSEGRIVGGTTAPNGAYPWMVAMTNGRNRNFLCGASVISVRHVLTAAHCIEAAVTLGQLSSTLRVTVGTNRWNSGGQTYSLQRHLNHPQYNRLTIKNDIGILYPASNIVTSNTVRAIPLSWDLVGANVPVRVAGWGRIQSGGPISNTLLELRTNTIDGQRCVTEIQRIGIGSIRLPAVDPNVEICTFIGANRGACNGDSGSPLVRNSNNQQIGIVSWGLPCARGVPDMFARVSAFRTWIQNAMR